MRRVLIALLAAGPLAVAAPVPKAPPAPSPKAGAAFMLGTGVIAENPKSGLKTLRFSCSVDASPLASSIDPAVLPDGKPTTRTFNYQLAAVKVTTADGKELTGDDLTKALAEPVAAVRSASAFDPEWRKLFADDVLFVELVRPVGGVIAPNPGGGVVRPLPGGGVVRPLPIRPLPIRPLPVDPVEEKPVEKK